jgi:hypothetical protein
LSNISNSPGGLGGGIVAAGGMNSFSSISNSPGSGAAAGCSSISNSPGSDGAAELGRSKYRLHGVGAAVCRSNSDELGSGGAAAPGRLSYGLSKRGTPCGSSNQCSLSCDIGGGHARGAAAGECESGLSGVRSSLSGVGTGGLGGGAAVETAGT